MLEQDKPKTLPGILQPTIHKRIQNLRVSCILSFFKESSALLGQILVTRFIWLNVFGFFYMPSTEVGHLSVRVTYLRISFHRQCRRPGLFCHLCENSNPTGPSFVSLWSLFNKNANQLIFWWISSSKVSLPVSQTQAWYLWLETQLAAWSLFCCTWWSAHYGWESDQMQINDLPWSPSATRSLAQLATKRLGYL